MPSPAIDIDALLTDEEENLKLEQISATHPGILDLLGDSGNPLYAEPHSMAKHFDAMILGAHAIGQLPNQGIVRTLRHSPVFMRMRPGKYVRKSFAAWT